MFYVLKSGHHSSYFESGEIVRRDGGYLVSVSRPEVRGTYTDGFIVEHYKPLSREQLLWLEKELTEQLSGVQAALLHQPGDFKKGDLVYRDNGKHKASPYTVLHTTPTHCWLIRFNGDTTTDYEPEIIQRSPRMNWIRRD